MLTIYDLKPRFQNLLRPITRWLATHNITANQVTLLALGLSIITGMFLAMNATQPKAFLILPVILFMRMALNAIDGMLAREHHMKSPLGAILNELTDVISDAALYLPFALVPLVSLWLIIMIVMMAILSEMIGVIAIQIGASRRYDGPMGKSDRAFIFGVTGLALGLGVNVGTWLNVVLAAVLVLTSWTIINRARQALLEIRS
jgi:CDP-diacylglycerol--glycerol-3-phosphate 3-phosphatidyltransferase